MRWRKQNEDPLPVAPKGFHYEEAGQSRRGSVPFRDPYHFRHGGEDWLLHALEAPRSAAV
ncbi:MAG TPA: hypothetical protein VMC79_06240 [Rectinemataceae bacterium]|nr:hypothetical protein [Rectinemataceae bacterium]